MKDLNHKFRELLQNQCGNRAVYMIKQFLDLMLRTLKNLRFVQITFFFSFKKTHTYGELSSNAQV